jgi:hypothetical protein
MMFGNDFWHWRAKDSFAFMDALIAEMENDWDGPHRVNLFYSTVDNYLNAV